MTRRVALSICTYNRNDELARLIARAADAAPVETPDVELVVVVVDDSADGNARSTADAARSAHGLEVTYVNTASSDIALARNTAITTGMAQAEFVCCIDDDCVPEPSWMRELLRVADTHRADLVVGHREFVAPPGSPSWLSAEPFLLDNEVYDDGAVPRYGNTANILIRSSWLESSGVRFRRDLGKTSGEDMVFLADAVASGAEIRYAAHSVVHEPYGGNRTSLRYQWWRQLWLGNNQAQINRKTHEATTVRVVLRGCKRMALGLAHPFARLASRQHPQLRWATARFLSGFGLAVGALGVKLHHRT